ncbi:MAG: hypothetical protein M0030_29550 [Actinomycetota bacterium]|nr:hypothetical protein [Actinomycetota bacterium]
MARDSADVAIVNGMRTGGHFGGNLAEDLVSPHDDRHRKQQSRQGGHADRNHHDQQAAVDHTGD